MSRVIQERRSRATGTTVQVIDNRDGSFDSGDLGWFTLCTDHGGVCSHPTRRLALDWAPVPNEWCPVCQGADDPDDVDADRDDTGRVERAEDLADHEVTPEWEAWLHGGPVPHRSEE